MVLTIDFKHFHHLTWVNNLPYSMNMRTSSTRLILFHFMCKNAIYFSSKKACSKFCNLSAVLEHHSQDHLICQNCWLFISCVKIVFHILFIEKEEKQKKKKKNQIRQLNAQYTIQLSQDTNINSTHLQNNFHIKT